MEIIETNLEFKPMQIRKTTERIILHHADAYTCSPEDIHRWHLQNGWSGAGYHFLVRKDGKVYRLRPENMVGSHAGGSNYNSIGICFEGRFNQETMENEQLKAGIELINYLRIRYNIKLIQKHKDVCNTSCPGNNFPFTALTETKEAPTINYNEDDHVLRYQKAYNLCINYSLLEDNIKGPETIKSLNNVLLKYYMENELVYWMQDRLKNYKGYDLDVDGKFGRDTERVVKEFQRDNGLVVDGIAGPKTLILLFK